jgi:hypothetical protein
VEPSDSKCKTPLEGGVANPLEWKGGLNDHPGAVLVPAV